MSSDVTTLENEARSAAQYGDDDARFWRAVDAMLSADGAVLRDLTSRAHQEQDEALRTFWSAVLGRLAEARPTDVPKSSVELVREWGQEASGGALIVAVLGALRRLGDRASVDWLASLREHPNADVREQLAETLAVLCSTSEPCDEAGLAALLSLATDPNRHVREWATHGLGRLTGPTSDPRVLAALRERASDPDENVRLEALHSLARLGDKGALLHVLEHGELDSDLLEAVTRVGPDWDLYLALDRVARRSATDLSVLQEALRATRPSSADSLLAQIRRELDELLKRLQKPHDEYERLLNAKRALDSSVAEAKTARKRRAPRSKRRAGTPPRRDAARHAKQSGDSQPA